MADAAEIMAVLRGLPWVGIIIALAVIAFSWAGLQWLDKNVMDQNESAELMNKMFTEGADSIDPSKREGFYGGWTDDYFWNQNAEEVEIMLWVPEDIKGKEIRIDVTSKSIDATVRGKAIISGPLCAAVKSSETVWYLERDFVGGAKPPEPGQIAVSITLQKKMSTNPGTHWLELLDGDESYKGR
mmetsp:Transcript_46752/g.145966  ORF Transcript_46752/g.145966 Transcript_46752/m.145966 type:complete len:185 (-) Transcript_46752:104-658(-)|eukprot:CAMPEP_0118879290 /NCGR_PEP_ID=MMETSP1163-20130328/19131_1 /TAXON_ID=124430 /ORGANISM="Phaeomonas parva, Strain CCMP2877" /LENGTH=184 /DNA_ID=CAMNT_0006815405 /DNA_START=143 /DNA_END=697 /DNA_ORIENTATION=+